jgi:hypothetical protein
MFACFYLLRNSTFLVLRFDIPRRRDALVACLCVARRQAAPLPWEHMTEEPDALIALVRVCGGAARQRAALPGTLPTAEYRIRGCKGEIEGEMKRMKADWSGMTYTSDSPPKALFSLFSPCEAFFISKILSFSAR